MDNLQLRQRIVRSMIRVSERTANMRKPEKFEYRKHMTAAFMDMLELCIEANRARGSRRVELQNKMDTKLDVLRADPKVSFEADCPGTVSGGITSCTYGMNYQSVIGRGTPRFWPWTLPP